MTPHGSAPLLFGPYATPEVDVGDWVMDEITGLSEVGGWMPRGKIPWPRRKKTGRAAPILIGDLVVALKRESVEAVACHWGVSKRTVTGWRTTLGIDRVTDGTRELLRERTGVPPEAAVRGRQNARSPQSRLKMIETKTGVPAHPNTREALLRAACAPKPAGWGKRANARMRQGKREAALARLARIGGDLAKKLET